MSERATWRSVGPLCSCSTGWLQDLATLKFKFTGCPFTVLLPDPDWHRITVPATDCPRISPEFLDRARKTMSDCWFRQEYLCEFGDNEETIFPLHLIERAINDDLEPLFP